MKFIKSKKGLVLLATLVVAAAAAIGAYAYFTSTGSGQGSATVGTATNWTVGETGSPTGGPLYPDAAIGGANIQTDTYTVTNGGSGSQQLTSVDIKVADSSGNDWYACAGDATPNGSHVCAGGTNALGLAANGNAACQASDFSVGGQPVGSDWNDTSLAGDYTAGSHLDGTVTVELIDNNDNQDACQGVTVPLYFFAS